MYTVVYVSCNDIIYQQSKLLSVGTMMRSVNLLTYTKLISVGTESSKKAGGQGDSAITSVQPKNL